MFNSFHSKTITTEKAPKVISLNNPTWNCLKTLRIHRVLLFLRKGCKIGIFQRSAKELIRATHLLVSFSYYLLLLLISLYTQQEQCIAIVYCRWTLAFQTLYVDTSKMTFCRNLNAFKNKLNIDKNHCAFQCCFYFFRFSSNRIEHSKLQNCSYVLKITSRARVLSEKYRACFPGSSYAL